MIWDPDKWHKAREAEGARLFFRFDELEAKANRPFTPEQREAIETEARQFIRDIYEFPDPATVLGAKEFRRECNRILSAFRRSARHRSLEPLKHALENAHQKGLEFAHGEVYRALPAINEKRLSVWHRVELRKAAKRASQFQGRHTRKSYYSFSVTARSLYEIYRQAGGTKRSGHWWEVRYRRRGDQMEPVTTDRYIGETLDFIQSVFDQLADSVCWYIREDDVETFKKAFENNTPPPNTFRQNIARAIKTQIDLTSD